MPAWIFDFPGAGGRRGTGLALIGVLAGGFIASGIAGVDAGAALSPRRAFGDLPPTVQLAAAKKAGAAVRATASGARKYCRVLSGHARELSSFAAVRKDNVLLTEVIKFYRGCPLSCLVPKDRSPGRRPRTISRFYSKRWAKGRADGCFWKRRLRPIAKR